jgi:hypothetical protein
MALRKVRIGELDMSIVELKPCPTCWCKREDAPYTWQECTDEWVVICPSCNVNGPSHPTESEVITAWNTRQPAASDDVLEAAAGAVFQAMYGPNADPFQNPEGFEFCRSIAAAALTAQAKAQEPEPWEFEIGQPVEKFTGEALWQGWIASRYKTRSGKRRYVVEVDPQGFQMIAVPSQLRARDA